MDYFIYGATLNRNDIRAHYERRRDFHHFKIEQVSQAGNPNTFSIEVSSCDESGTTCIPITTEIDTEATLVRFSRWENRDVFIGKEWQLDKIPQRGLRKIKRLKLKPTAFTNHSDYPIEYTQFNIVVTTDDFVLGFKENQSLFLSVINIITLPVRFILSLFLSLIGQERNFDRQIKPSPPASDRDNDWYQQ